MLKKVIFQEESALQEIGCYCFSSSGLEEITLPSALKEIGILAFKTCFDLKTIYVKGGCQVDLSGLGVPDSIRIVRL